MNIDDVVTGLRNTPWHPNLFAIVDLSLYGRLAGLIEERVFISRHHQKRHQVFKHRAAPRNESRISAESCEQTSESKPVFLRYLSLSDRHETRESRLRCQQVVVTGIEPAFTCVVADGEQPAFFVEQKVIFHACEPLRSNRKAPNSLHSFGCGLAQIIESVSTLPQERIRPPFRFATLSQIEAGNGPFQTLQTNFQGCAGIIENVPEIDSGNIHQNA